MTTTNGFSVTQFFVSAIVASAVIGACAGIASADSRLGVSVDVGAEGATIVRGAEVTAVTDSEVKAETSWGETVLNWVVKTDADTDYIGTKGETTARSDIAVGDTVSFRGVLDQALSGLVVKASSVKNWSKTNVLTKINGGVTSINASVHSFVVTRGNTETTVETNASTTFTKDGDDAEFADISLDGNVKVEGTWNASTSAFTASKVEIDTDGKGRGHRMMRLGAWFKFWNH